MKKCRKLLGFGAEIDSFGVHHKVLLIGIRGVALALAQKLALPTPLMLAAELNLNAREIICGILRRR